MTITLKTMLPRRTKADGGEHMAIIGQTGTGKSTLCRYLLRMIPNGALGIYDPKRDFKYKEVDPTLPVFNRMADVWKKKPHRFVYRPLPALLMSVADLDSFYHYCFEHKNMTVYTDDVMGIVKQHKPPPYLILCYTLGRSLGLNMISCFQRPSGLPLVMTTECRRYAIFTLSEILDIRRVRGYCIGYNPTLMKQVAAEEGWKPKHVFSFYCPDFMDSCQPFIVQLEGR